MTQQTGIVTPKRVIALKADNNDHRRGPVDILLNDGTWVRSGEVNYQMSKSEDEEVMLNVFITGDLVAVFPFSMVEHPERGYFPHLIKK